MALGYRLTITDNNGSEIFLSSMLVDRDDKRPDDIINASYKLNTIDNDALSRSNEARAEITISGIISELNTKETCKLASWAKETNSDLIYRKVKLVIYANTDENAKMLRSYEIEQMFVLDYKETFCNSSEDNKEGSSGQFELYVVQKKGNHSQYIETE